MSHEVAAAAADLEEIRRLRAELEATRADLDTLRNGVAWLGAELDRAKRWAALWKRAATRHWINAWRLEGILRGERARRQDTDAALDSARAYADEVEQERGELRDRALGILRVARQLVAAWREQRQRAGYWEGVADLHRQALQRAWERADRLSGAETNENSPDHPTV